MSFSSKIHSNLTTNSYQKSLKSQQHIEKQVFKRKELKQI